MRLALRCKPIDRFMLVTDAMPSVGMTEKSFILQGQHDPRRGRGLRRSWIDGRNRASLTSAGLWFVSPTFGPNGAMMPTAEPSNDRRPTIGSAACFAESRPVRHAAEREFELRVGRPVRSGGIAA